MKPDLPGCGKIGSKPIMNVIFLDIDGVLNSNLWNENHQKEIKEWMLIDTNES